MGSFSITHWLILLVVVVVVFGTSKLKNIGKDVGSAVKDFKEAVHDETTERVKNSGQVLNHTSTNIDTSIVPENNDSKNTNS